MTNTNYSIYIKNNNKLVFDLGFLSAGDFKRILSEALSLLDEMDRPFFSIFNLSRMVRTYTLIHPEDYDALYLLAETLSREGGALSFCIAPEDALLYKIWRTLIPNANEIIRIDSEEEAENMIRSILEPALI